MTGPSAIGSENGRPNSMMSAPASVSACNSSTVCSAPGWPPVIYGISARRPAPLSSANFFEIASDEMVAGADAISVRIVSLDDRASEHALGISIGEVDENSRMENVPLRVWYDTDDRTREHLLERIRR